MTPQQQLFRHCPEEGLHGDCFRASLACLLDLPVAEVPHFYDRATGPATVEMKAQIADFFAARGEKLLQFAICIEPATVEEALRVVGSMFQGVHHLLMGGTGRDTNHVVIVKDGAIVYDVHPDRVGIVGPCEDGWFWLTFVGRLV